METHFTFNYWYLDCIYCIRALSSWRPNWKLFWANFLAHRGKFLAKIVDLVFNLNTPLALWYIRGGTQCMLWYWQNIGGAAEAGISYCNQGRLLPEYGTTGFPLWQAKFPLWQAKHNFNPPPFPPQKLPKFIYNEKMVVSNRKV